jgi:hypothetical protein
MSNPWADPSTPTQPGPPYQGPPPTVPYGGYPPAPGHPAPYGYPAFGYPPASGYGPPAPWGPPPPQAPRRPGQVITSAVLAFVQAVVVLLASLYLWFFASIAEVAIAGAAAEAGATYSSATVEALATEGTVLAVVQLISVVFLVGAGIVALVRRTRAGWLLLLVAHAVQVVLAIYWAVRLLDLFGDIPGATGEEGFAAFTLFFAAAPLVGFGLLALGPGRRWFGGASQA